MKVLTTERAYAAARKRKTEQEDELRGPLSFEEQEALSEAINLLPDRLLPGAMQIIREDDFVNDDDVEVDLDIDQLDTKTQRRLLRFVMQNVEIKKRQTKMANDVKPRAEALLQDVHEGTRSDALSVESDASFDDYDSELEDLDDAFEEDVDEAFEDFDKSFVNPAFSGKRARLTIMYQVLKLWGLHLLDNSTSPLGMVVEVDRDDDDERKPKKRKRKIVVSKREIDMLSK
jgi:hypothetical protein